MAIVLTSTELAHLAALRAQAAASTTAGAYAPIYQWLAKLVKGGVGKDLIRAGYQFDMYRDRAIAPQKADPVAVLTVSLTGCCLGGHAASNEESFNRAA